VSTVLSVNRDAPIEDKLSEVLVAPRKYCPSPEY
jgi:hypothetical protein